MNPLLTESAVELARRIRTREVSPVEVVEAHLARVEDVNPHLNAVVQPLYAEARRRAKEAEAAVLRADRARPDLPPFHGVPCTIKEHYKVKGLPQTGGLLKRRQAVADEDATLVARMREAGFIFLGTTNVPEALTWYESYNKVYGRTNNAYSLAHTSGGSSGGEGAIIGAGGSPIGLGGDIGGSIRLPAAFNGVVGHKATGGRVPETGCWPGARGLIGRYKVCGPLGRRVEDLKALMPILARPDGRDATVDGPEWGDAPEVDPHTVTVYWFDDNDVVAPSADIRAAVRKATSSLAAMGCRVERWRPAGIERAFQIWANALEHAGGPKYIDTLGDFEPVDLFRQWLRWPLGKSDHIFPCLALATLEAAVAKFPAWGRRVADLRLDLQREIETKLGSSGVLLCPVFHRTAPRHGLEAMREFLGFTYSGGLNPTEIPATAVPMGFGACGLPTAVQVAAVRHNDHLTLEVAGWLERAHGGWRPGPIRGVES